MKRLWTGLNCVSSLIESCSRMLPVGSGSLGEWFCGGLVDCGVACEIVAACVCRHRQTKNVSSANRTALLGNYTPGYLVPKDDMERQV